MAPREVTAKFKVAALDPSSDNGTTVTLYPDYADGRNKEWSKYTPAGSITLTVKDEVVDAFPPGQSFLVTFTPEDGAAGG